MSNINPFAALDEDAKIPKVTAPTRKRGDFDPILKGQSGTSSSSSLPDTSKEGSYRDQMRAANEKKRSEKPGKASQKAAGQTRKEKRKVGKEEK